MQRSLVILGFAILLFGCVEIGYHHKVERNGNSAITETIDLSGLLAMSNSTGQPADVCINVTKGETDVKCTFKDGVLNVSRTFSETDGYYTFSKSSEFPNIIYTLEVRKLPPVVDQSAGGTGAPALDADFKSPGSKVSSKTLDAAGAEISYEVEMPGEIYSAENGKIEDGKAVYNVLDLMDDGEYIVVRSRELDMQSLLLAALGVLGLAL